jgi:hypothetical protein
VYHQQMTSIFENIEHHQTSNSNSEDRHQFNNHVSNAVPIQFKKTSRRVTHLRSMVHNSREAIKENICHNEEFSKLDSGEKGRCNSGGETRSRTGSFAESQFGNIGA